MKKFLAAIIIVALSTIPAHAQFSKNPIIKDDGTLVEGQGRIIDFQSNLSATFNSSTGAYEIDSPDVTGDSVITSDTVITDNAVVRGDGGASGIQESGWTIDDSDNLTGPDGEKITNSSDGIVCLSGAVGSNNSDLCINFNSSLGRPTIYTNTSDKIIVSDGLVPASLEIAFAYFNTAVQAKKFFPRNAGEDLLFSDLSGNLLMTMEDSGDILLTPVNNVGIGTSSPGQKLSVAGGILGNSLRGTPPSEEIIAAGATITANACGTIKQISTDDLGAVTTSTTDTVTAPASTNTGCCMTIINTGTDNITLDNNANFISIGAADIVMTANDAAEVCSNGSNWYSTGSLVAN